MKNEPSSSLQLHCLPPLRSPGSHDRRIRQGEGCPIEIEPTSAGRPAIAAGYKSDALVPDPLVPPPPEPARAEFPEIKV